MTRRSAVAGLAGALAVPAAVCAQTSAPLTTVHVGGSADVDAAPILYGIQAGIFRRYGIDLVYAKASSGSAVSAAVAGGALEFGKSSMVPLISAHARNVPLTIVGPSIVHRLGRADSALLVAAGSPIRSARDLNGKPVSVAGLRDMQWLATHAWLDANGGDSSSVEFLELPGASVASALEQGRISAGTLSEPYITLALTAGKARILAKMVDALGNAMTTAYFTTVDYATKNRELAGRFARAVIEASAYCNTHPAEMTDVMSGFTGIDRDTLAAMVQPQFALGVDARSIQPIVNAAATYKVIPQAFNAQELIFPLTAGRG
ncbi:MAG TPA: ABC transporter substrate-binding protein [Candidatus Lustribacter sp.]|jgi:NitT/TauT family transport system substrate-binding protein|nr:ABC transporter substrate-binding protein [Candidatus Lustribacter sp.]